MTNTNAISRLILAGVTRGQIASAVGCTRAAVSHWERGRSIPSNQKLKALVQFASERGVVLLASDFGHAANDDREAA